MLTEYQRFRVSVLEMQGLWGLLSEVGGLWFCCLGSDCWLKFVKGIRITVERKGQNCAQVQGFISLSFKP